VPQRPPGCSSSSTPATARRPRVQAGAGGIARARTAGHFTLKGWPAGRHLHTKSLPAHKSSQPLHNKGDTNEITREEMAAMTTRSRGRRRPWHPAPACSVHGRNGSSHRPGAYPCTVVGIDASAQAVPAYQFARDAPIHPGRGDDALHHLPGPEGTPGRRASVVRRRRHRRPSTTAPRRRRPATPTSS